MLGEGYSYSEPKNVETFKVASGLEDLLGTVTHGFNKQTSDLKIPSNYENASSKYLDDPFRELTEAPLPEGSTTKGQFANDDDDQGGFDDFQDANPMSSIHEVSDSRHDSNIFSNSKQDIENNSFSS